MAALPAREPHPVNAALAALAAKARPEAENPKKALGDEKPGVHFVPMNVMLDVAEVMKLGASKYGIKNWREQPIRASTYYDAMFRHMTQWYEGLENEDAESHKSHLCHVIACCLLVLDSEKRGILVDDRAFAEAITRNQK